MAGNKNAHARHHFKEMERAQTADEKREERLRRKREKRERKRLEKEAAQGQ
jgi:hypothetical protein